MTHLLINLCSSHIYKNDTNEILSVCALHGILVVDERSLFML